MEVQALELTDFRNYEKARLRLGPGLNLVVGENGQGKTNLVEAIYVLGARGSHRVSHIAPLVRAGAERAILRAEATVAGRTLTIDAEIKRAGGIRTRVNRASTATNPALSGIAAVMFSPEDLALAKGGPEDRRRFIDQVAAKVRPRAEADRLGFDRALRQRNGALKAAQSSDRARSSLEVWDDQVTKSGAVVVVHRMAALDAMGSSIPAHYGDLAGYGGVEVRYSATWVSDEASTPEEIAASLKAALEADRGKDLERGVTHSGPHRDDLNLTIDGADARVFASQGEQRSLVLSLRLAERDLVAETRREPPILLLDDVFSELDDHRRGRLAQMISGGGQTICTATSDAGLPVAPARIARVSAGEIIEVE